jgi:SAM-dependent methyltransferase
MKPSKKTSVDLGCGTNPRNPFNADRLIGVDCHPPFGNVMQCDIGFEALPFNDASIDFVTAFDFIEHLPRFALREKPFNPFIDAMSEIWRILKPNAVFFAKTPAYPSAAAFQDPTHVNIITDQTVGYFAKRPCLDGTLIDPLLLPLGKQYGFKGEFLLIRQWWEGMHLCWLMRTTKEG